MTELRQYPDGRVLALTGECPKGFKNFLFIGWTGSPDKLEEVVVEKSKLPPVVEDIPSEWKTALKSKGFEFDVESDCEDCAQKDNTIYRLELEIARFNARKLNYVQERTILSDIWFILMVLSWIALAMYIFV